MYDDEYYEKLDLDTFLYQYDTTSPDRARNEKYGDAMAAIHAKSEFEEISSDKVIQILGQPDKITDKGDYEIWEYGYYSKHGPATLFGEMPFKIVNGIVCYWHSPEEVRVE